MNPTLARAVCACGLIAGPLLLGAMAAGSPQVSGSPETRRPPERLDDPWLPRDPALGSAPGTQMSLGQFLSIQVNINADDLNIIGDAANEPSIGVDPTAPNRIVIGWRQFDTIASNFRQGGWGYSHDGGRTWTFPGVLEPGIFRSDPVVDADDQGRFYYLSLHTDLAEVWECRMFISQDGGLSWGEGNFAFGGDKAWFAFDRSGGIGHGNLYQAWNTGGNRYFPNQFNRSIDGGLNWSQPIEMPMRPVFGTVAVGSAGRVFVAGWSSGAIRIVRSSNAQDPDVTPTFDLAQSVDLGGSFSGARGPNPAGLLGQVWVAIDRSGGPMDGNVYMLSSVNPPGTDPLDVMFGRSEDGAKTWSGPVRVNDDASSPDAWQWFGTMSVAPTGRIDVIFNDTRMSQQANISELFYTASTDSGRTWSKNIAVSPPFDSWVGWPNQNKIGDYYDMVSDAVGAHVAWSATFNGEQDVYYLRIGDYDCNSNGVPDNDDLDSGDSGDCNDNGIPDECEIAAGTVKDDNRDGIPDECVVIGDLDGDGSVGASDLLILLVSWGPCDDCNDCPADIDGNCTVGASDLLILLANWG